MTHIFDGPDPVPAAPCGVDLAKLTAPFPATAIKQRQGGGNSRFSYVEGHTVIHRLNDATGNRWSFKVLTLEWRDRTLMATVELTIPGLGSRQHVGIQDAGQGGDIIKGAVTDALKKASTLFGVGLELYGPDYEAGEVDAPPAQAQRQGYGQPRQYGGR